MIFAYEDSLSGHQMNQVAASLNADMFRFFKLSMDFFELAISRSLAEFVPLVRENLRKIQQRMNKLLQKKENVMLAHFMKSLNLGSQAHVQGETCS